MADICQRCISTIVPSFAKFIHFALYPAFFSHKLGQNDQVLFGAHHNPIAGRYLSMYRNRNFAFFLKFLSFSNIKSPFSLSF